MLARVALNSITSRQLKLNNQLIYPIGSIYKSLDHVISSVSSENELHVQPNVYFKMNNKFLVIEILW